MDFPLLSVKFDARYEAVKLQSRFACRPEQAEFAMYGRTNTEAVVPYYSSVRHLCLRPSSAVKSGTQGASTSGQETAMSCYDLENMAIVIVYETKLPTFETF